MDKYKYDLAVSLCKQDVEFARNLLSQINPNLKVFFYEDKQDVILTNSGPEVFAKAFKLESRIVMILARKEWSESFYTEIEKNAIIDRTSTNGYSFLIVIPMEPNGSPPWYPSTRIYVSPTKFSVDQIAKFVEFKITEEGGVVKPVTLERIYEQIQHKIKAKQNLTALQESQEAIATARAEIEKFKNTFNTKADLLKSPLYASTSYSMFAGNSLRSEFNIGSFQLECVINDLEKEGVRIVTTQDYDITLKISQLSNDKKSVIVLGTYYFLYTMTMFGWSPTYNESSYANDDLSILFRNRNNRKHYNLKNPQNTEELVDNYFRQLLTLSSSSLSAII